MSAALDRGREMAAVADHDPAVVPVTAPLPSAIRARRFRRSALVLLVQALILIAFLAFWEYEAGKSKQSAFMFGSPSAIWSFLWKMILDGSLLRDISVTGLETVLGFLIGNMIGTFVGLCYGIPCSSRAWCSRS
jgi:NitT/TauT family transport system permease protein